MKDKNMVTKRTQDKSKPSFDPVKWEANN